MRSLYVYNDELYAGGDFDLAGGVPAPRIAKWDGLQWCGLGNYYNYSVRSITSLNNELYIECGFLVVGNDTIIRIARWTGGSYTDTCGNATGTLPVFPLPNEVSIYPNPTRRGANVFVHIETPAHEGLLVRIHNVTGQLVLEQPLPYPHKKSEEIYISGLGRGVYVLTVHSRDMVRSAKLLLY